MVGDLVENSLVSCRSARACAPTASIQYKRMLYMLTIGLRQQGSLSGMKLGRRDSQEEGPTYAQGTGKDGSE